MYSILSMFQSAGRIIGWLKDFIPGTLQDFDDVSIRRADYWLVELKELLALLQTSVVSIRRADYWLVEPRQRRSHARTN